MEKAGTGYKRMNELCKESNIRWSFENVAYGFYFTFYRENAVPIVQPNVQDKSNNFDLNKNEKLIYEMIKNNPKILKSELAAKIKKSEKTV